MTPGVAPGSIPRQTDDSELGGPQRKLRSFSPMPSGPTTAVAQPRATRQAASGRSSGRAGTRMAAGFAPLDPGFGSAGERSRPAGPALVKKPCASRVHPQVERRPRNEHRSTPPTRRDRPRRQDAHRRATASRLACPALPSSTETPPRSPPSSRRCLTAPPARARDRNQDAGRPTTDDTLRPNPALDIEGDAQRESSTLDVAAAGPRSGSKRARSAHRSWHATSATRTAAARPVLVTRLRPVRTRAPGARPAIRLA